MLLFQVLLVFDEPDLNDIFLPDSDFLAVDLDELFEAVARLERVAVLLRRTVVVDLRVAVLVLAVGLELVLSVAAVASSEVVDGLAVLFASAFALALAFPEADASVLPIVEFAVVPPLFQYAA